MTTILDYNTFTIWLVVAVSIIAALVNLMFCAFSKCNTVKKPFRLLAGLIMIVSSIAYTLLGFGYLTTEDGKYVFRPILLLIIILLIAEATADWTKPHKV